MMLTRKAMPIWTADVRAGVMSLVSSGRERARSRLTMPEMAAGREWGNAAKRGKVGEAAGSPRKGPGQRRRRYVDKEALHMTKLAVRSRKASDLGVLRE